MAYLQLFIFVGVLLISPRNVKSFTCTDAQCIVHCSSTTKCSNTVINGANSTLLKVICNGGDSTCDHLDIICPQNVNGSECQLACNGNYGCTNVNFYPFESNASIHCGNNPNIHNKNITMSICSNLTISSPLNRVTHSPSDSLNNTAQNITLNCTVASEQSSSSPTCSSITFLNMGYIPSQHLFIICDAAYFVSNTSANIACSNFNLQHEDTYPKDLNITTVAIHNYFGLRDLNILNLTAGSFVIKNYNEISHVNIPSQSIHSLDIYNHRKSHMHNMRIRHTVSTLTNNGVITRMKMHQFENITVGSLGQIHSSNISSINMQNTLNISGLVNDCVLSLIQDINHINNTFTLFHNGLFANNTLNIHAHCDMIIDGVFELNAINLINTDSDFMNRMKINLNGSSSWINNTIAAYFTELLDIKTSSLFSGTIYANDTCNNFSLRCEHKADVEDTCKNLTLYTAPAYVDAMNHVHYPTYLECIGYGCQYISIWSLSGLNDVHFAATQCPCSVNCIDSCMGQWNIYCSNVSDYNASHVEYNLHALFADGECEPYQCCGDILNQSDPYFVCSPNLYQNVVCSRSVGLDIALIASLTMAGIILCFFIFLGGRFMFRKIKKDELQKELERKRQMEEDKRKKSRKNKKKIHKLQTMPHEEPLLQKFEPQNIE